MCEFLPNMWASVGQIKHLMGIQIVSKFCKQIKTLISAAAAIDKYQ